MDLQNGSRGIFATYPEGMDEELSSFFPEFSFYLLNIRNEAKAAIEVPVLNRILKGIGHLGE